MQASVDLVRLRDLLARLDGDPPYDDPDTNEHMDDGFFAMAIEREFGQSLGALRDLLRTAPALA